MKLFPNLTLLLAAFVMFFRPCRGILEVIQAYSEVVKVATKLLELCAHFAAKNPENPGPGAAMNFTLTGKECVDRVVGSPPNTDIEHWDWKKISDGLSGRSRDEMDTDQGLCYVIISMMSFALIPCEPTRKAVEELDSLAKNGRLLRYYGYIYVDAIGPDWHQIMYKCLTGIGCKVEGKHLPVWDNEMDEHNKRSVYYNG
jgi:hypothetical protein